MSDKTITVSAVVPIYGGWDYVAALLEDLRHEAIDQIILVDDAGPPPPDDWPEAGPLDQNVRIVTRATNGGFASAVNTGVAAATTSHVLIVNSDARVDRSNLDRFVAHMRTTDAVHGPRIVRVDGDPIFTGRQFPTLARRLWTFALPLRLLGGLDRRVRGVHVHPDQAEPIAVDWLSGAVLGVRRDTFRRIGPLDEQFHMYGEDVEWQRRAAMAHIDRLLHTDVTFRHDVGHGVERDRDALNRRYLQFWQGELIDTGLHGGRVDVAVLRVGLVILSVVNLPFTVARERLTTAVSAATYLRVPFASRFPKGR